MKKTSTKLWNESFYVQSYILAKEGLPDKEIAKAFGVSVNTLVKWKIRKPALAEAFKKARTTSGKSHAQTFHEYVYDRLPSKLQKLWDKINEIETEEFATKKLQAILKGKTKRTKQHLFLHALVGSSFNTSQALKKLNIPKTILQNWINYDPGFAELMDQIHWHKKNFFEAALVDLIKSGNAPATIFANKTANQDRGYGEKIDVSVSGNVSVNHSFVSMDELKPFLNLETRKTILAAMKAFRAKKEADEKALESTKED